MYLSRKSKPDRIIKWIRNIYSQKKSEQQLCAVLQKPHKLHWIYATPTKGSLYKTRSLELMQLNITSSILYTCILSMLTSQNIAHEQSLSRHINEAVCLSMHFNLPLSLQLFSFHSSRFGCRAIKLGHHLFTDPEVKQVTVVIIPAVCIVIEPRACTVFISALIGVGFSTVPVAETKITMSF